MGLNWPELGRYTNMQAYYDYLEDLDKKMHWDESRHLRKTKPFCHNCFKKFSSGKERNKHLKENECL